MTPQNDLDLKGNFHTHPFAELLTEISAAKLAGSLRIERGDQKMIVYLDDGAVIYAVSNARKFRLSEILGAENAAVKEFLTKAPAFPNDLEFANALKERSVLNDEQVKAGFTKQAEAIIGEALGWPDAEWTFSPLSRLKSGMRSEPKIEQLLAAHARNLSHNAISFRFMSMHEMFEIKLTAPDVVLEPDEAFILSRLTETPTTIADIIKMTGLVESEAMKVLYTLWLAGAVVRREWNAAFSDFRVAKIRTANLKLTKSATEVAKPKAPEPVAPAPVVKEVPEVVVEDISLADYLERVEKAETHYDILGLPFDVKLPEVRQTYFTLAKLFHPDKFHRDVPATLRRIENAFSKLAQAHDALRDPGKRTAYDNKVRREMTDRKNKPDEPLKVEVQGNQLHAERAGQEFEHGRNLLVDGEYDEALPFLARAVHLAPTMASYHAFYGKALSFVENGRHKAEGEMQAAVKLEPNNTTYRFMLAEFFFDLKSMKRAEGELNRLLAIAPDHKEARALLDSLRLK
ncbi:MAG: DUF4388 domain-containing protein [Acidobacteriota bacterium]